MIRAYLDIETSWGRRITVIGVHRPDQGTRQWVSPNLSTSELRDFLAGVEVLFTYNGARFDLPVIRDQLDLDLAREFCHQDLMHDCWNRSLYGGLKKVEQTLGISRDTAGINGIDAMNLWERFSRRRDQCALATLLQYNREDVENLETLALRLGIVEPPAGQTASPILGAKAE